MLGNNVATTQANSVVLGNLSTDRAATAVTGTTIAGTIYTFAGAGSAANGVVSVGAAGKERQIINVAAGDISATSTDAINGSQLFATNSAVDQLSTQVTNINNGAAGPVQRTGNSNELALVAPGGTAAAPGAAQKLTNVAAGNVAAGSTDAVNGGQLYATNQEINNITSGKAGPFVSDNAAAAPGPVSSGANALAGGFGASATGAASSVVGNGAKDNGVANSTVLGNGASIATGLQGSNVALGQGSTVAESAVGTKGTTINGKDYAFAGTTPAGAVSVGSVGNERTITNVGAGRLSATSTDAINGSQLFATNQAVDDLASNLGSGGEFAVKYDVVDGKKSNSITLQGGDPAAPVLISNVRAGVADTDAANVGQVKQAISTANSYTDVQVGQALQTAVNYTNQVAAQTLGQANAYTDMRFNQLSQQIGDVQREARQAGAIGLAASSLRYDERPGKISASVGGGLWKGYAAGALGVGYTSRDFNVRANVSAATTGDSWGIGAGLTFTLN